MAEQLTRPYALLWDLDETMGQFKPTWLESRGHTLPDEVKELGGVRYGLSDLLEEFSEENGYVNFVTTAASTVYANTVLERTRLLPYFKEVYGRGTVVPENYRGTGKFYRHVAENHGYTDGEIADKMLAIGNTPEDKPLDTNNMVFMELGPTWRMDALVIREVITTVLEKGEGSFNEGFKKLYSEAENTDNPEEQRIHHINDDIQFRMEYRESPRVDGNSITIQRLPVITDVIAPLYIRPGVRI